MNYTKTLRAPFQLDAGGYYGRFNPATDKDGPKSVFGSSVPDWKREMKLKSSRRFESRKVKGAH